MKLTTKDLHDYLTGEHYPDKTKVERDLPLLVAIPGLGRFYVYSLLEDEGEFVLMAREGDGGRGN